MVVLASNLITAGSIIDGDRGDITVSASGGIWTIDSGAVTTSKLATLTPGIVISGTSTSDALRITQLGTGNALVVEDDTNPDATRFAVNQTGDVGVGVAPFNFVGGYTSVRIGNSGIGGILDFLSGTLTAGRLSNTNNSFTVESFTPAPLIFRTNTANERFRIADNGAWGLAGVNYGTAGQVITSNGSGAAPTWQTVSGGSLSDGDKGDITVSGTGTVFTIDNGVITTAKLATLDPGVVISGSSTGDALRITQTGTGNALVVEDDTNPDATRFAIGASGDLGIGVVPATFAGFTSVRVSGSTGGLMDFLTGSNTGGRIFNSTTSFVVESGVSAAINTTPLVFRTNQSVERFRIADTGAFGLSGANYGTSGQVITSNGSGSAPTWQTPSAGGGSGGQAIILSMIFGR